MARKLFCSSMLAMMAILSTAAIPLRALAGPPLICHPIEIGNARSLPWAGKEWRDVKTDYDLNRLVEDTLALLTAETPVIVRMETLRRATIYAVWANRDREVGLQKKNDQVADQLLTRLMDRLRESARGEKPNAFALFDVGYLTASYGQAGYESKTVPSGKLDAYTMVRKASEMRGVDPAMEFAAAIITEHPRHQMHSVHLQRAIAGTQDGSLLARNLVTHFGRDGQKFADLRAQMAATKN